MKGILLAGGRATRLYPVTRAVSKHLLPVYDKPMFYYPLCTLMQSGVRELLLISNARDIELFRQHLGDGSTLGMRVCYAIQHFPLGIADALRIGRSFVSGERCALALGDNVFFGTSHLSALKAAAAEQDAVIFGIEAEDPTQYGVVEIGPDGRALSIEEKPKHPRSNLAVPGLYFYPGDACEIACNLTPSDRGELEITDVNAEYLRQGRLKAVVLDTIWLDAGTFDGLLTAVTLASKEHASGRSPGCVEAEALAQGFIDRAQFERIVKGYAGTAYGEMLKSAGNLL
ncbi:MAG: sugar nucleotidyltransferase [Christensenellales bacterium]